MHAELHRACKIIRFVVRFVEVPHEWRHYVQAFNNEMVKHIRSRARKHMAGLFIIKSASSDYL